MSKRELKKYLGELTKAQLEEQLLDLYGRFKEVKEFYDFAFNPKEDKLLEESKWKISKEYFPVNGRKPKLRRSVAQNIIRHFRTLGVDVHIIADLMLYNIEVAQTYSKDKPIKQSTFFKSMQKSFEEALDFIEQNSLSIEFSDRIDTIAEEAWQQNWENKSVFEKLRGSYDQY